MAARTHFSQHKDGNTRNKIGGHRKHHGIDTATSTLVLAVEQETGPRQRVKQREDTGTIKVEGR